MKAGHGDQMLAVGEEEFAQISSGGGALTKLT